jgi:hypothetical protein
MAGVQVHISSASLHNALNTPGGVIYEWRDETAQKVALHATATAPVNNPMNAVHRGGAVGEFKASFGWERYGNQHVSGARVYNTSDHAEYAELGRGDSHRVQRFSWANWAGEIRTVWPGPGGISAHGWKGHHTLRDAANAVMPGATGGSYVPLV